MTLVPDSWSNEPIIVNKDLQQLFKVSGRIFFPGLNLRPSACKADAGIGVQKEGG